MEQSTSQEEDPRSAYATNVAGYLVKPMEYERLVQMMRVKNQSYAQIAYPAHGGVREEVLQGSDRK